MPWSCRFRRAPLRIVCGLSTPSIARLLLPEPTLAQRLVRAKRKIRDAGIRLQVPEASDRPTRPAEVLRTIDYRFAVMTPRP